MFVAIFKNENYGFKWKSNFLNKFSSLGKKVFYDNRPFLKEKKIFNDEVIMTRKVILWMNEDDVFIQKRFFPNQVNQENVLNEESYENEVLQKEKSVLFNIHKTELFDKLKFRQWSKVLWFSQRIKILW